MYAYCSEERAQVFPGILFTMRKRQPLSSLQSPRQFVIVSFSAPCLLHAGVSVPHSTFTTIPRHLGKCLLILQDWMAQETCQWIPPDPFRIAPQAWLRRRTEHEFFPDLLAAALPQWTMSNLKRGAAFACPRSSTILRINLLWFLEWQVEMSL